MKKPLLPIVGILLFFAVVQLQAQTTVPRKPLIEVFTSSTCPPCVRGNVVVDAVLENNPGEYALVKYQMNWPGTGDPYYMAASMSRRSYYAVTGVPSLKTNGTDAGYPGYWTQGMFDALAGTTHMTIGGQAAVTTTPGGTKTGGLTVNCQLDITALEAYATGLRAFAVVVEHNTFYNATTNGETEFHNVAQGYLLSSDGAALGALTQGQVKSFDLTLDLSDSNTETGNDLAVVVFVQNFDTKEIIQSEIIEVTHPFVDYSATFAIYDDDYNPIDGGKMVVEYGGTAHAKDGKFSVERLFPGTYNFEVVVPGYLPYSGDFTVSDADLMDNLFVEIPPFKYYEDFEAEGLPAGWKLKNSRNEYFQWYMGELTYQNTSGSQDALYLTVPRVTIDQGCIFTIKAGKSQGTSHLGLGVTTTPDDPGASYAEIVNHEIFGIENMKTFGGRLDPQTLGDGYLCIKIVADAANNFFYLDDCIVIENMPGYKVQFKVVDQSGEVLPETEVTLAGATLPTNTFGYATWRDVDEAEYAYSVSYKGQVVETGTVNVWEDMVKEIVWNTSGIGLTETETVGFYPNPATSQITINGVTEGTVKILNMTGQTVLEQAISNGNSVSVKELPVGVYFVKIKSSKGEVIQRLIKK